MQRACICGDGLVLRMSCARPVGPLKADVRPHATHASGVCVVGLASEVRASAEVGALVGHSVQGGIKRQKLEHVFEERVPAARPTDSIRASQSCCRVCCHQSCNLSRPGRVCTHPSPWGRPHVCHRYQTLGPCRRPGPRTLGPRSIQSDQYW